MFEEVEEFLEKHPEWAVCPDFAISPPTDEELLEWYPELTREFLDRSFEPVNIAGDMVVSRGALYAQLRMNGSAHSFAEMIALQKGPGLDTDDIFFSGQGTLYDQFGSEKHLQKFVKNAKANGYTPSPNDVYYPGLARFQGDPEAFVSRSQGRSYIKKLCERRGWACEGGVKVEHRQPGDDPLSKENCVALGEDIIRDRAAVMHMEKPETRRMDRTELRKKIIQEHGPSK